MRTSWKLSLAALVLAVFAAPVFAQGTIVGTKHDMTSGTQSQAYDNAGNAQGQICVYCHTPHNTVAGSGPIWNRTASLETYTMYGSTQAGTTMDATPGAESLACLSCHDGTVAIDSISNIPGDATSWTSNGLNLAGTFAEVGSDLSDDHPVSFTVDFTKASLDTQANIELTGIKFFGVGNNKMECATCHDVHNGPGNDSFLRVQPQNSDICLTCHQK